MLTESTVTRIKILEFYQILAADFSVLQDLDAQMLNRKYVALQVRFPTQQISPKLDVKMKNYAWITSGVSVRPKNRKTCANLRYVLEKWP